MSDLFIVRRRGSIAWTAAEGLVVRRVGQPLDVGLSATAAAVWSLCDGRQRVSDIRGFLGEKFPDQHEQIENELPRALAILEQSELTRTSEHASSGYPVLQVATAAFWPGLQERDNPIVQLLARRYSVVLVSPEQADLLLFSTFGAVPAVDPERTLRVFYAPLGLASEQGAAYDVALIGRGESSARHLLLPTWSLYCDWQKGEEAATHPDAGELLTYHPEQVCGRLVAALEACQSPPEAPRAPAVRPSASELRLTLGMATHGDYDGVYFTVQALKLYHPEVLEQAEIIILDNAPEDPAAEPLRNLAKAVPGARYEAFDEYTGTAIRDLVFRLARAPSVVCVDSHVLLPPGVLQRLLTYLERDPASRDLVQGPLLYDDHKSLSTHFRPGWGAGMYGQWGTDPRGTDWDGEPFEIPMQGLGLFACRRDGWPGLNPRFRGFGGEEGYLHEKFRRQGGRVLCLPFLRWQHRFARPQGIPFTNTWDDRIRNYLIGHHELGLDPAPVHAHFQELLGEAGEAAVRARVEAEIADPLFRFDAIYVLSGAAGRVAVRRLGAEPPQSEVERALAHREALERAWRYGFETVLVADHLPTLDEGRGAALDHLWDGAWDALDLASSGVSSKAELGAGVSVAYSRRALAQLLGEIPASPTAVAAWLDGETLTQRLGKRVDLRIVGADGAQAR
ncbi:MAG: PqqD family peptide modification chaperone [Acidobacteriota bacterium]